MHRDVISNADLSQFAEYGLVIFVTVFILIILRALFMKKERVEHMEKLPLDDGQDGDDHTAFCTDDIQKEEAPA